MTSGECTGTQIFGQIQKNIDTTKYLAWVCNPSTIYVKVKKEKNWLQPLSLKHELMTCIACVDVYFIYVVCLNAKL